MLIHHKAIATTVEILKEMVSRHKAKNVMIIADDKTKETLSAIVVGYFDSLELVEDGSDKCDVIIVAGSIDGNIYDKIKELHMKCKIGLIVFTPECGIDLDEADSICLRNRIIQAGPHWMVIFWNLFLAV